jgi:predicted ATPase
MPGRSNCAGRLNRRPISSPRSGGCTKSRSTGRTIRKAFRWRFNVWRSPRQWTIPACSSKRITQCGDPTILWVNTSERFFHVEAGLAIYDRAQHEQLSVHYGVHDVGSCALYERALALWNLGFLDQARSWLERSTSLAHALDLPANIADSYAYAALLYHLLRDPFAVQRYAEPAFRISAEKGYPYSRILGAGLLGWSLTLQGEMDEGIALAQQAMTAARESGQRLHHTHLAVLLAESLILAQRYRTAIEVSEDAIAQFEKHRDLLCAPDLWTLKGNALLALSAADADVEECYQAALSLSQELGAKTSELRAATWFARLRQRQGRFAEAVLALEEIYGWFTEGFDTPDLRAAKALLDELVGKE